MSLSTQTQHRLPQIKEGLLSGKNYTEIGLICGVTERTIDRDVKAWVESRQFETWIKEEWLRLHTIILDKYPVEAYREVSRLLGKTLTQRIEAREQVEIKQAIIVKMWKPELESTS